MTSRRHVFDLFGLLSNVFKKNDPQMELALGLFCIGTIYITQTSIVKPTCTISLSEDDVASVITEIRR